jgi:Rrf2 family protein
MVISKRCSYAIRAALYLATRPEGQYVPVREISDKLHLSAHFLTKIFQTLTAGDLMLSFRGPNGGVKLARPSKSIRVIDVIELVDGQGLFQSCVLGLEGCGEERPCPLHDLWAGVRGQIQTLFESATLDAVAADIEKGQLRITDFLASGSELRGNKKR